MIDNVIADVTGRTGTHIYVFFFGYSTFWQKGHLLAFKFWVANCDIIIAAENTSDWCIRL